MDCINCGWIECVDLVVIKVWPDSVVTKKDHFVQGYEENIVRDLAAAFEVNLFEKFTGILNDSKESMSIPNKQEWWQERLKLDTEMNVS